MIPIWKLNDNSVLNEENCTWVFVSKPYTKSLYIYKWWWTCFRNGASFLMNFHFWFAYLRHNLQNIHPHFCRLAHAFFTQITYNSHEWFMFSCSFDLYLITRKSDDDDDDDMLYSQFANASPHSHANDFWENHYTVVLTLLWTRSDPSNHPFLLLLFLDCVILFHTVSFTLPVVLCISCNFQNSRKISTLLLCSVRLSSYVSWQSDFAQYVSTYGNWLIDTWKITQYSVPVITARYTSTVFYSSYRIHNSPLFWWFYPIYELKYKVSMHTKFFSCLTVCRTMWKLIHFWTSLTNPNKDLCDQQIICLSNIDTFEIITVKKNQAEQNSRIKNQKLKENSSW